MVFNLAFIFCQLEVFHFTVFVCLVAVSAPSIVDYEYLVRYEYVLACSLDHTFLLARILDLIEFKSVRSRALLCQPLVAFCVLLSKLAVVVVFLVA